MILWIPSLQKCALNIGRLARTENDKWTHEIKKDWDVKLM